MEARRAPQYAKPALAESREHDSHAFRHHSFSKRSRRPDRLTLQDGAHRQIRTVGLPTRIRVALPLSHAVVSEERSASVSFGPKYRSPSPSDDDGAPGRTRTDMVPLRRRTPILWTTEAKMDDRAGIEPASTLLCRQPHCQPAPYRQRNWSAWLDLNQRSLPSKGSGLARLSHTQMALSGGVEPPPAVP